jgi:hypothetical protein
LVQGDNIINQLIIFAEKYYWSVGMDSNVVVAFS